MSTQPEKKFRAGAVTATVWKNQSEKDGNKTSYNSISLERVYKDKQGNWQSTNSFRVGDLPKLNLVAQKAFEFVTLSEASEEASI